MNITRTRSGSWGGQVATATQSLEVYFISHHQAISEWHLEDRKNESVPTLICYLF